MVCIGGRSLPTVLSLRRKHSSSRWQNIDPQPPCPPWPPEKTPTSNRTKESIIVLASTLRSHDQRLKRGRHARYTTGPQCSAHSASRTRCRVDYCGRFPGGCPSSRRDDTGSALEPSTTSSRPWTLPWQSRARHLRRWSGGRPRCLPRRKCYRATSIPCLTERRGSIARAFTVRCPLRLPISLVFHDFVMLTGDIVQNCPSGRECRRESTLLVTSDDDSRLDECFANGPLILPLRPHRGQNTNSLRQRLPPQCIILLDTGLGPGTDARAQSVYLDGDTGTLYL